MCRPIHAIPAAAIVDFNPRLLREIPGLWADFLSPLPNIPDDALKRTLSMTLLPRSSFKH